MSAIAVELKITNIAKSLNKIFIIKINLYTRKEGFIYLKSPFWNSHNPSIDRYL